MKLWPFSANGSLPLGAGEKKAQQEASIFSSALSHGKGFPLDIDEISLNARTGKTQSCLQLGNFLELRSHAKV